MATGNDSRMKTSCAEFASNGLIFVAGSFELNGDDASPINARGDGFVVTHSGGDDYLITFAELYPMMVSFVCTLEDAAAGTNVIDAVASIEAYVAGSGTVILRVAKEATDTLTKNDTLDGERVNFVAVFQKYTALAVTHA